MDIAAIFSQPITQAGGLFAVLLALHKSGIVDVKAVVRSAIGIDVGVRDVNADSRNVMQTVLLKVEELSRYANHDTTENIGRVEKKLDDLNDNLREHFRSDDKIALILEDIREHGIKCRKE